MAATTIVSAEATSARDDPITICAISCLAWILAAVSHEGIGHALVALLTGTQTGVLSTVAWSSAYDSRLVAAGGTLVNLIEAGVLWLALRSLKSASPRLRLFLCAGFAFNLFTGTGYFLFSGAFDFGDWAQVIARTHPHWLWRFLLVAVGAAAYYGAVRAVAVGVVRYVGVLPSEYLRLRKVNLTTYFSAIVLSVAGALMNPLGFKLVLESALPAAAGANCAFLWLRYYIPRGTLPVRDSDSISRGYAWIAMAAVLSLVFVFVLGRGITLNR